MDIHERPGNNSPSFNLNSKKKYIITGATSPIGLDLCDIISNSGNLVTAVCRKESVELKKLASLNSFNIVYADLADLDNKLSIFDKADVFINLAWGSTSHAGRDNKDAQEKNVYLTLNAIRVAKSLCCQLFVEAGSQAEYGYVPDIITEETPCHPETEYGKAKLKVYDEGTALCKQFGMKYLHLRIFSVFGENDHCWTFIMSALDKMLNNDDVELSACTQKWNYLYVKDAVRQIYEICRYALETNSIISEIFHIASEDTRPLKFFVEEMYKITGSKSRLLYGHIQPSKCISLDPSIMKTKRSIGFVSDYSFDQAIKSILSDFRKKAK